MLDANRARARAQLDKRLSGKGLRTQLSVPTKGYIKAIRYALGMTSEQLGRRMGIAQPSVSSLETSEKNGTINISKLRAAAEAMNCELVYALVPSDQTLDDMVRKKARELATTALKRVDHSMSLEGQNTQDNLHEDLEVAFYINECIRDRDLWDDS